MKRCAMLLFVSLLTLQGCMRREGADEKQCRERGGILVLTRQPSQVCIHRDALINLETGQ